MSNEKVSEDAQLSKSAAKRMQRKQELVAKKRKSMIIKTVSIVVAAVILVTIAYFAITEAMYRMNRTTASGDFSAYLTEEGKIDGIDVTKYVEDFGYNNITIAAADVEYTAEEMEADIQEQLDANPELVTDAATEVADGDRVNIDYVGYIDGEPFEGGDTEGNGTDLTIGSGNYIDDFETQLIGSHPGDTLTVDVTFPDDYTTDPTKAGLDASFEVVINGVYTTPEFNDAFVATHLSEYASTADEYREYLTTTTYDTDIRTAIQTYIADNASLSSYPKGYLNVLKSLQKYSDEANYEYYNSYYSQMLGSNLYDSFEDYTGMSDKAYEKSLVTSAKSAEAVAMTYQYIFEQEGLTVTDEAYNELLAEFGDTAVETYGTGYLRQAAMRRAVVEYLVGIVTVA